MTPCTVRNGETKREEGHGVLGKTPFFFYLAPGGGDARRADVLAASPARGGGFLEPSRVEEVRQGTVVLSPKISSREGVGVDGGTRANRGDGGAASIRRSRGGMATPAGA